jgi:bacteriocin-like protein
MEKPINNKATELQNKAQETANVTAEITDQNSIPSQAELTDEEMAQIAGGKTIMIASKGFSEWI